ncbi:hypothetical protein ACHAXA_004641 [Cyclostephanos tholiformis]|uniref:TraB n=1 Tax=Cyclostephanos tholiformis TaxID=382380 RepID=A0ABD3RCF5_9STRA
MTMPSILLILPLLLSRPSVFGEGCAHAFASSPTMPTSRVRSMSWSSSTHRATTTTSFAWGGASFLLHEDRRRRLRRLRVAVRVGGDDVDRDISMTMTTTTNNNDNIDRRAAISRSTSYLAGAATATSTSSIVVGMGPYPARASSSVGTPAGGVDVIGRGGTSSSSSSSSSRSAIVSTALLCDPSVSTWVRTYDGLDGEASMRTVHILGTAHISSSSAELAGRMVRDLRPDVVFVELDAKRVARAIPGGVGGGGGGGRVGGRLPVGGGGGGGVGTGDGGGGYAVEGGGGPTSGATTSVVASSSGGEAYHGRTNPFDVNSRLVDAGSRVVGESVKNMYTKLESEGFKAGDEFATSVREGLAIGSTIVLGDRDVEVTLRRLTRALVRTDIRKLLAPDSEVERSMEELLPEGMKKSLRQSSSNAGVGGGSDIGPGNTDRMTSMGLDVSIDKRDFNDFVETMKAKDNIKKIMSALRNTAPEIYEAMVAERDEYMGRGLDELGQNLTGRSIGRTVAVVGMAHVDGIERFLASRGWTEMRYPCPIMR